jgi:type I restriction enzyme, S subunit
MPWITPADLSGYREKYIKRGRRNLTPEGLANSSAKPMPTGTVLFSSRAPVGYVVVAANEVATNQGFKSFLVPHGFDSSYLYYYLRHIKPEAEARATGTTFKELSGSAAAKLPLLVAPSQEQKHIADKLDAVFARFDACRERLDRVPQILKRFREAVLEAAVSGRLTEEWRAPNQDHVPWVDGTFGSTGHVSGGLTKNATRAEFAFRRPYLRVANVYTNRLELDDVTEIGMTPAEWDKTRLQPGDLLIVEGNGSIDHIGRAARWGGELPECSHQNHLIRWRTHGKVDSRFALLWLMSPVGRSALMDLASTSAGLYTLSISKISKVPMRVPSAQEQAEIIRRSDDLLAHADALVRQYDNCMVKLEKLSPSILAKAFRGELVPQDPNDEPAGQMLERMRASGSTDHISTPKLRAAAGRRR